MVTTMVDEVVAKRLAALAWSPDTGMKRSLEEAPPHCNPVDDAQACLKTYNETLVEIREMPDGPQRRALVESLESMDAILYDFLEDQAAISNVYGDVETTELIKHGTPIDQMEISVCTLLLVNEHDPNDFFSLDFWGDEGLGRGAPLKFMRHALDHAKRLVFYNGIRFDLRVIASGDETKEAEWARKTHDPYLLLRDEFGRDVSLKLDALLASNGLDPKTGDGKAAVQMYKRGQFEELQAYNLRDVEALKELTMLPSIRLSNGERTTLVSLAPSGESSSSNSQDPESNATAPEDVVQGSHEWFALRKNRVTSTLVGAVLGLSPFMNREEAHDTLQGTASAPDETEAMREGRRREVEAIANYEHVTGNAIQSVGFVVSRERDWAGASPDGLGRDDKRLVIEVKVPKDGKPTPKPSFGYFLQCQWHLYCTGRSYCDFVSLGADVFTVVRIRHDPSLVKFLLPIFESFWQHAQTDDEFPLELSQMERREAIDEVKESMEMAIGDVKLYRLAIHPQ